MDSFMVAWEALDRMALSLPDPTQREAAQQVNRQILSWYINAFQAGQSFEQKVPNGKPAGQQVQKP